MQYKTYIYIPLNPYRPIAEIKSCLPNWVNQELVDKSNAFYVEVESRKKEIVKYLDDYFNIDDFQGCCREVILEVDKKEIPNYTHFTIMPDFLHWDRTVFFDVVRPTCPKDSCPVGSKIIPPVRISARVIKRIGIAEIGRAWDNQRELIISSHLKSLFDYEGVTGLDYERCEFHDKNSQNISEDLLPYYARIPNTTYRYAKDIHIGSWHCEKHMLPSSYRLHNDFIPEELLSDHDFQTINSVMVQGKTYNYYRPTLVISRKVLELLLSYRIRGLLSPCCYLSEKFLPLVTSPAINSMEDDPLVLSSAFSGEDDIFKT